MGRRRPEERRKLADRGRLGAIVGYARMRALVVLDMMHFHTTTPHEVKLVVTRDFRLKENHFPLKHYKSEEIAIDVVLLKLLKSLFMETKRHQKLLIEGLMKLSYLPALFLEQ